MKSEFSTDRLCAPPAIRSWLFLISTALSFALTSDCLAAGKLLTANPQTGLLSYRLISYANLLLLISTILYIAHLWFTARALGRWATTLAAVGSLGLVTGLLMHTAKSYGLHPDTIVFFTSLSEVMTLFCAVTVILYLLMERVYRSRSAGAFVMPIVATAILFEMLGGTSMPVAPKSHFSILQNFWIQAHVLGNFIAYSAFAFAAGLGVLYLQQHRRYEQGVAPKPSGTAPLDLARIQRLMNQAISLGFFLLTITTISGGDSSNQAWERYWNWNLKETASWIVWLCYAGYMYLDYAAICSAPRMALYAILAFALAALCFLGVPFFLPVLHA